MLDCLVMQKEDINRVMLQAAESSRAISSHISNAVVNMQFQDRNSQYIENAVNTLTLFARECSEAPVSTDNAIAGELAHFLCEQFKLSEFRSAFIAHLAAHGWSADCLPEQHPPSPSSGDDDIELF